MRQRMAWILPTVLLLLPVSSFAADTATVIAKFKEKVPRVAKAFSTAYG